MKIEEGILQDMERDRLSRVVNSGGETNNASKNTRFMIAGEAPVLLGKACELLIKEMSARAWRHTERNRRRTLQRQDVHAAVGESEVYDFLIDIVPRMTSVQPPPQPPSFAEHHIPPVPQSIPMAPMAPMAAPAAQPDMGMADGVGYALQMHQMQEPQVPVGYEHYYMQMHQARMQAEAAAPPQMPPNGYMAPDAMTPWGSAPPQQHGNNDQAPGAGV
jgi:nuclear transcription factor Y gamma